MQITEIISQKNGKLKICLDSGMSFSVYRKEASAYGLAEGIDISEEQWGRIRAEVLDKRAKKRALYLLQKMDRTESQLCRKLKESGYPSESVACALDYVKSFHYIDDERYASAYIRCHQNQKSRMQLKIALQQKGVRADVIERALAESYEGEEETLVYKLLEKKHYDAEEMDRKEKYRIYQYLLRRGFSGSLVRRCMEL